MSPATAPVALADADLFRPLKVGNMLLQHRIAMAPLTRHRASDAHVPSAMAVEYYGQRSSSPGTLLISEATFIAPRAAGFKNTPAVWADEQIEGWKKVVKRVHDNGSYIFLQLWAIGRAAEAPVLSDEFGHTDVVSAGDIPLDGGATPRPLTVAEIKEYTELYAEAARNFVEKAGGDGVEIHGANGYLIDQFTQNVSNNRTDAYGGSVVNRTRFALEVVEAVTAAVGASRVGLRLSPFSPWQSMKMSTEDTRETFGYLVEQLKERYGGLAYLHVVEARIGGIHDVEVKEGENSDFIYDIWSPRPFLIAGGFTPITALQEASTRKNTVVVFGRSFISTPDLPKRIKYGVELNKWDRSTFYEVGSERGYVDLPVAPELVGLA